MLLFTLLSCSSKTSLFFFERFVVLSRVSKYVLLKKRSFLIKIVTSFFFKKILQLFGRLKTSFKSHLLFLLRIKTISGMRHIFNLPVNGQRSKTNANTRRRLRLDVSSLTKNV